MIIKKTGQKTMMHTFLSYFIIAVLSVALNLVGYAAAMRVLRNEIEQNDRGVLRNIAMFGDQHFADVRSRAYLLLSSGTQGDDAVKNADRSFFVKSVLQKMRNSDDPDGDSGTLYSMIYRDSGEVIQNGLGICSVDIAYKQAYADLYPSVDLWIDNVFSAPGANYKSVVSQNGQIELLLTYYIPNLFNRIAVTAKLDRNYLKNIFPSADPKDGIYVLADSEGRVLVSSVEDIEFDRESVLSSGRDAVLEGGLYFKTVVSAAGMDGFYYVKFTPQNLYMAKIKRVRSFFVLGYLLILLLGALVAFLFARVHVRRRSLLQTENEKYKSMVMDDVFKRMLFHESLPSDSEYLRELSRRTAGEYFVLVYFKLFKLNEDDTALDKEYVNDMLEWLQNRLDAELQPQSLYTTLLGRDILALIGLGYQENCDSLKAALQRVCETAKRGFEVEIFCIVSERAENFSQLHKLYAQVLDNSNNVFLYQQDNVLLCKPVEEQGIAYIYTAKMKEKLIFLLQNSDREAAVSLVNSLLQEGKKYSLLTGKVLLSEIISTILTVCPESMQNERLEKQMQEISEFYSTAGYFKLRESLGGYIGDVCTAISADTKKGEISDKCTEIMEYIKENYADNSINVNVLANRFHVDRTWLSKKFKEQYGENISDFIVKYRVEKAKELLVTDLSVEQIAESVGFVDRSTYYRAFKKFEHITSKQYRELLKIKKENRSKEDDPVGA